MPAHLQVIACDTQSIRHRFGITFADFHVFQVWDLLRAPALVIGMDVLGTLNEFSIDYPRGEFLLKVERRLPPVQFGAYD